MFEEFASFLVFVGVEVKIRLENEGSCIGVSDKRKGSELIIEKI